MTSRSRLPNRRLAETFQFATADGQRYFATVGKFADGRIAEVFINSATKLSSTADVNAADGAVAVSLALQYGCPIDVLRTAMKRNHEGRALGPLGAVLDEASEHTKSQGGNWECQS